MEKKGGAAWVQTAHRGGLSGELKGLTASVDTALSYTSAPHLDAPAPHFHTLPVAAEE